MAYRWKTRSSTPGDYNFVAGTLENLAPASKFQGGEIRGDGVEGTYVGEGSEPLPTTPTLSIVAGSGSVVATIDGDAGVTNHLLYRGNDSDWQDGGNRVGDGDITVSGLSNNVNYFFMAYSEYGGLVSVASNAVDVTLAETSDNDFDTILDDTAPIFLEAFGETVTYLPGSGGSRSILAIVNRPEASKITGLPHGSGAALIIEVANDSATGISAAEIDRGRDKVQLAERFGDTAKTKRITNILAQDAGMVKLELQ